MVAFMSPPTGSSLISLLYLNCEQWYFKGIVHLNIIFSYVKFNKIYVT